MHTVPETHPLPPESYLPLHTGLLTITYAPSDFPTILCQISFPARPNLCQTAGSVSDYHLLHRYELQIFHFSASIHEEQHYPELYDPEYLYKKAHNVLQLLNFRAHKKLPDNSPLRQMLSYSVHCYNQLHYDYEYCFLPNVPIPGPYIHQHRHSSVPEFPWSFQNE